MTTEEKKKRLRYLQLKAKAGQAAPAEETTIEEKAPVEKPGLLEKATGVAKDIGTGLVKGFGEAASQGTAAVTSGLVSGLSLLPGDMPPTSPAKVYRELRESGAKQPIHKSLEAEGGVEKAAKFVGETGTKIAAGGVAAAPIKGTGLLTNLAKGAVTNIPFLPEVATESGKEGVVTDVILNTALDAVMHGTGKLVTGGLKKISGDILQSQLKIEKKLAKKISPSFNKAKDRIVEIIDENGLNTITNNFEKMAQEADRLFIQNVEKADKLILDYATQNPGKTIDVTDFFAELEKGVVSKKGVVPGEFNQGRKVVQNIFNDLIDEGLIPNNGKVSLPQLVELKRSLNEGQKLFKSGTGNITADPVKAQIYEKAFLDIVSTVDKLVPEAATANRKARDLLFVKEAVETADSASKNRNKVFGATELVTGSAGGVAAFANPDKAISIIALSSLVIAGKKAGSQGRGPALTKGVGQLTEKLPPQTGFATSSVISEAATKPLKKDKEDQPYRLPGYRY